MIDPTHLRIGNLILDITGHEAVVRGVTAKGVWLHDEGGPGPAIAFQPILLTPEWLERIELPEEFKEDFEINTFKNSIGIITDYWISKRTYCQECTDVIVVNELKYLHTLQNAVHLLTSQELTINP